MAGEDLSEAFHQFQLAELDSVDRNDWMKGQHRGVLITGEMSGAVYAGQIPCVVYENFTEQNIRLLSSSIAYE